jgi:hypothetical protein
VTSDSKVIESTKSGWQNTAVLPPGSHFLSSSRLRAGDWVQALSAEEILATLDSSGALDGLVFMPEMLEFCGRRFQIRGRAEQIVTDGVPLPSGESRVRSFKESDVVLLDGLRCSGGYHGGCKRGCMTFWKEKWLRRIAKPAAPCSANLRGHFQHNLAEQLSTSGAPGKMYCQSSEIMRATLTISWRARMSNSIRNVRNRNYSSWQMLGMLATWVRWKLQQKLTGVYPRGVRKSTPRETLDLQPGELVQVKSLKEIVDTLDKSGKNRGLHFSPDMVPFCGKQLRVRCRTDNLVAEGTGQMRQLKDTVLLEDSTCNSATYAFGGCLRDDFLYWREIWLRRATQQQIAPPRSSK